MRVNSLLGFVGGAALITIACGGTKNAPPVPPGQEITITIAPTTIDMQVGESRLFKATVAGSTDTTVVWSISASNSAAGTDIGSIDSSGLYNAPQWVASELAVNVMATSNADPTQSASAVATVRVPARPVLLWKATPAGTTLTTALTCCDGRLLAGGYSPATIDPTKSVATVLAFGPTGNQLGRFDDATESKILPRTAVTDGIVLFFGGQKGTPQNPVPLLLAFYGNLDRKFELTCSSPGFMSGLGYSPSTTLYFGAVSDPNPLVLGTADPDSETINCLTNLAIRHAVGARLSGLAATGDRISVSGHNAVQGDCSNNNGFVGQFSLQGQVRWMSDFSRDNTIAPNTVISPALLQTTEGGRDFLYVSGAWLGCQGTQQFLTAKFDQTGNKVWQRLWDGGNTQSTTISGVAAVTPWPSGNIAVVGSLTQLSPADGSTDSTDCALVVYKPDGTQVFAGHQNEFNGANIACQGATTTSDNHFLYEVGQIKQQSMMVVKYALPPQ